MPDANVIAWIRDKFLAIVAQLDERGRRRWAAVEARSLGRGGVTAVAAATGISDRTVRNGIRELDDPEALAWDRQRKPGGGRRSREDSRPELIQALEALVEPVTRGDPMSPLRWTCKSTRVLGRELTAQGFQIGSTKVGELLKLRGYSLQSNRKTLEGTRHADRNAQFEHIARRVKARQATLRRAGDFRRHAEEGNAGNPQEFLENVSTQRSARQSEAARFSRQAFGQVGAMRRV